MKLLVTLAVVACSGDAVHLKPERSWRPARELCVTEGAIGPVGSITAPAMRGFDRTSSGDAARLEFTYHGPTREISELASGDVRSQLGLKLRAEDSCNLVYVMWRFAPKPEIVVQVKRNPGKTRHEECGAEGYARVKPRQRAKLAAPQPGSKHTLAASIDDDQIQVWADATLVWQGALPEAARQLRGHSGVRTDNVDAELSLSVVEGPPADAVAECPSHTRE